MMEAEFINLKTDLRATQRKLNLLCSWIQLKFGDDPTLPGSLYNRDQSIDDEVCLKYEHSNDFVSPEIQLVNWESIIAPSDEVLQNISESHSLDCQVCGKSFFSPRLFKLHKTEHCFVKVQRLSSTSRSEDPLMARITREHEKDCVPLESDSSYPGSDPEDDEFIPQNTTDSVSDKEDKGHVDETTTGSSVSGELDEATKTLSCNDCEEQFIDENSLLVHRYTVHRESNFIRRKRRLYPCHVCGKSFLGTEHRLRHIKEHHADVFKLKEETKSANFARTDHLIFCPICNSGMTSRANVLKHIKTAHAAEATLEILASVGKPISYCGLCKIQFKKRVYYTSHLRLQHPQLYLEMKASGQIKPKNTKRFAELGKKMSKMTRGLLISCPLCGSPEKSKRQIRIHLETIHPLQVTPELLDSFVDKFDCEDCKQVIKGRDSYYQHLRRYHPSTYEQKVACGKIIRKCGRARPQKDTDQINENADVSHSPASLECPLCESRFKNRRKIQLHLKSSHAAEATSEILEKFKEPSFCDSCNKTYEHHTKYNTHLRKVHPEKYAEKIDNGEIFPRPSRQQPKGIKHRNEGTKGELVKCDECELILRRGSLPTHKRARHMGGVPKPYACPQCSFTTMRKDCLPTHMQIHSEERTHKCESCSYAAKQRQGLDAHIKSMHGPEPQLQCTLCGIMVKKLETLRRHIAEVHENSRPFACHLCEKAFKVKTHLKYHIKTHSNPNGRKRGLNKEREPRKRAPNKSTLKTNLTSCNSESMDFIASQNLEQNTTEGYEMSVENLSVFPNFNPWLQPLQHHP